MTATMLKTFDELTLDEPVEPAEATITAIAPRMAPRSAAIPECGCLLTAVGRCPTQLRAAPS
jgi:hypothetical protein